MTREEFIKTLEYTDDVIEPGVFSVFAKELLCHDAAQRAEIARLTEINNDWQREFKTAVDGYNAIEKDCERLREALRKLTNEVSGAVGIGEKELRDAIGGTNLSVIKMRIEEAKDAIKETT